MALLRSQSERLLADQFSSFNTVEKLLKTLVDKSIQNEPLKKLLYYTDKNALFLPNLSQDQTLSLLTTQIKIVPKVDISSDIKPYIVFAIEKVAPLAYDDVLYRQLILSVSIIVHYDHWTLDNMKLRPFTIAGQLDGMIANSYLNGVQVAEFVEAEQVVLNENFGGVALYYRLEIASDDYAKEK